MISGGAGADILDGGAGTDVVYEAANADFTISATLQISWTATGTRTTLGVEGFVLIVGASGNKLDASASTVSVRWLGGGGNDTLLGGSKADVLIGGNRSNTTSGTDSLVGGAGADILDNDSADQRTTETGEQVLANVFASLPNWIDAL